MYHEGQGVPQDYAQARLWLRKAAEQGVVQAQLNLGLMYALGQGVSRYYVQAHMWINLASSSDALDAGDHHRAIQARDEVAARMTPDEIAEAQRMASEWKPTK
jgi:TPR repeat protein